jgi:TolB-like protein
VATFLQEMKRRNVVRVTLFYIAMSWLVLQVADIVLPTFGIANWVMQALIVLSAAGLPVVVVLAWVYDLTPEGIQRTGEVAAQEVLVRPAGRKLDFLIIGLLSLALIAVVIDQYIVPGAEARLGPRSVIVLPFTSNQDEQSELFADGLLGEILTQLYKIKDLTTIGGVTSRHYRGTDKTIGLIAEEVGVAAVVSGNLIMAADHMRFDVELLEPKTGRMLWVNSYELPHAVQGLFDVQADIAFKIAQALQAQLTPLEQQQITDKTVTSEEAYAHYLLGEGYRQRFLWREAIAEFEQATREDPEFASAWASLAISRGWAHGTGLAPATLEQVDFAMKQARRIAPDAYDTLFAEAALGKSDGGAIAGLLRVLELQSAAVEPLTELAGYYTIALRLDEARKYAEQAVSLDPMNISAIWQLAFVYAWSWDFEQARTTYDRLLALEPSPLPRRFWGRYGIYLWGLGDRATAAQILADAPATITTVGAEIQLAYLDRNLTKMGELLELTEGEEQPPYWWLTKFQRLKGNVVLQRKYAELLRTEAEAGLEAELSRRAPAMDIESARSDIAVAMALAANEAEAVRTIELAVKNASTDEDRLNAAPVNFNEVRTYIYLGHNDIAIQRLQSFLSWAKPPWLTPYRLRVDPDFDSLRGNPDFEALLEELESSTKVMGSE